MRIRLVVGSLTAVIAVLYITAPPAQSAEARAQQPRVQARTQHPPQHRALHPRQRTRYRPHHRHWAISNARRQFAVLRKVAAHPVTRPAPASSHRPSPQPTNSSGPAPVGANTPMPTGDLANWHQVYADDFTGSTLNTWSAWSTYQNGPVPSNPDTAYWSPSHAKVGNGMLTIVGSRDPAVSPDGRIVTEGLGLWKLPAQTYGKYEALVRMDSCSAVKYAWLLWPSWGGWPNTGEIDFAEDEGGSRTGTVASVLYGNPDGSAATLPQNRLTPSRPMSDWHVVGVEWTPGSVRYTLDGALWGTVQSSHVPSGPMTFVLQTESKLYPGQVPATFGSCNAQVGWVVQYAMK
jgi:beta-glucanase (GH16 family)